MPAFAALACDYDGTLAIHDRIPAAVAEALAQARADGVRLVLVTGRTLFELTRVCERLELFDAVVAENGGVLYFPSDQALREEGPPPPAHLLEELDRRGVAFQVGRVVVAALHRDRDAVLDAVRAAGVDVDLVSNRAAVMLLPPFISKGTGLTSALLALGVAPRDVLAIGDAENDLPMFDVSGWSACPDDAVVEVKRRVDWILPGAAGEPIGRLIRQRVMTGDLPAPRRAQPVVHLGWSSVTSEAVTVAPRASNILVQGDSLCGKSSFVGGLVERLAAMHEAVCVVDPEGDYRVLGDGPGARTIDVRRPEDWDEVLAALGASTPVVADLSHLAHPAQVALADAGLARMRRARDECRLPHWIVIDEAHYLLHAAGVSHERAGLDAGGICLATYRASWLAPAVVEAMDMLVIGRTQDATELASLEARLAGRALPGRVVAEAARELPVGSFVIVRAGLPPTTIVPPPRAIRHIRHFTKYADAPTTHGFLFRAPGGAIVAAAATLAEFGELLRAMPAATIAHHAARGDFSRWIGDVVRDDLLAARVAKLERRWCRGEVVAFGDDVSELLRVAFSPARQP